MIHRYNIPSKINVGFQNRSDTYTGKLAYVVYTDDNGVLKKETSWNNWRDKKISPQEFENIPTDGFVLNKKVGETRWSHDPRKAWVRVYDPRDFEFEIDVSNLLLILQECTSVKGKGLEGKFVYAWSGGKLLLLPVDSQEYKESVAFKKAVANKVTKEDIKEGYCYLNKNGDEVMYLGRLPYWFFHRDWENSKLEFKSEKKNIFAYLDPNKKDYFVESGFANILSKVSDDPSPIFAEKFDKYKKSKHGSGPVKLVPVQKTSGSYMDFVKKGDEFYYIRDLYTWGNSSKNERADKQVQIVPGKSVIVPLETKVRDGNDHKVSLCIINESGKKLNIGEYYG